MPDYVDCIVIGAGVVGLAIARGMALKGRETLVLEAAASIGTGISSRNSEVIHAGIYYEHNSLKARLCVKGKSLIYQYCSDRGINYKRCGKLIVATQVAQVLQLQAIKDKAFRNGVKDLILLTGEEARTLEPEIFCEAALFSPSTGIIDSHSLMLALQGDLENAGGVVAFNSPLMHAICAANEIQLITKDETKLIARAVINSTGLAAPSLAKKFIGLNEHYVPQAYYAKGNYFTLKGRAPFSHLIYPVPEAAGLGVHLTLDLGGQAKFGPDVEWVDSADDLTVNPKRGDDFYAEVRKFWPALKDHSLQPGYAGIRPKINDRHQSSKDFCIQGPLQHGVPGLVNLFGIESPGLTSCLAIGDYVSSMV